ncbi:hypothetical protein PXW85_27095, partial [Klebsiella pneumoniae]|nr:hypothetical protein [Klebsiella pneumoniae]
IVMTMGPVAVAIILALILSFVIPLLVARYLFRRDLALSTLQAGPSQQPVRYAPVREDIARAAEAIACARHPVIFAQRGART